MGILISKTFEMHTPESIEEGDASERGYYWEDVDYSFRELVDLIESDGYIHRSSSGAIDGRDWLTTEDWTTDYKTGETERNSLHFSHNNPPSKAKYWVKAIAASKYIN